MPGSARKTAATTNSAGSRSSSSHNNNNNAAAQHLPDSSSTTTITTTNNTTNSTTHVSASTSDPILPSSAPGRTHSHARGLSVSQDASAASVADSPAESQAASPDDGTAPEDQRTKKRKGGPGSRGVANLTPEQLAKKRANGTFNLLGGRDSSYRTRIRRFQAPLRRSLLVYASCLRSPLDPPYIPL